MLSSIKQKVTFLAAIVSMCGAPLSAHALDPAPVVNGRLASVPAAQEVFREVERQRVIFIPMRDGIRLSTDIYRPVGANGSEPVVLMRTPYDKSASDTVADAERFARFGFTVVVQDHRGRFES